MQFKNYYKILEIDPKATNDQIKSAYHRLVFKYDPDINVDNPEAKNRYEEISEAHAVLNQSAKRKKYDQLLESWEQHQSENDSEPFDWIPWYNTKASSRFSMLFGNSRSNQEEFSDFYQTVFGTKTPPPTPQETATDEKPDATVEADEKSTEPESETSADGTEETTALDDAPEPEPERGEDYHQQIDISLEEVLKGTSRILRINNRRISVKIPKGAKTGTQIRVRNEGGIGKNGGSKGDLYLVIEVTPHDIFKREGSDLHMELPLDLYTAVLGGEAIVSTLSGKLKLKIFPETQSGRVFRIKSQGLPALQNSEERGDLYIKIMVQIPEGLSDDEIALFEELADIRGL